MTQSVNPATGAVIHEYTHTTSAEKECILADAQAAFGSWKYESYDSRAKTLRQIAAVIRERKEALATLATQEMGKPIAQSRDEVEKCARTFDFYAEKGAAMLADELIKTDATKSYVHYEPVGVVLAVMPWNFPYWQVLRCAAPILMAGNTMVLKHASNVWGCAMAIDSVFKAAGLPQNLLQTLLLPSSEVEALIDHPAVSAVTFTGSTTAGSKIAEAAGRNIKKQVLELGGSDAYIILEDADITKAVDICIRARLVNSGQSCVAGKRFVVVQSKRAAFEKAFTAAMQAATFGDPFDEASRIGPMARVDLRDALHEQVTASIAKGAKLLCGGEVPEMTGAYYPPTVLTDVTSGMPAYEEELFGPVAAIIAAKDEDDAMRLANDSVYGLGGCIISEDTARAESLAARGLQAGNCFVNDAVHSDPNLPFGGTKRSGYGRELGAFGIREFTVVKTVFIK